MSKIFKNLYKIKYCDISLNENIFIESYLSYFEEARFDILNSFIYYAENNGINVKFMRDNVYYLVTNIDIRNMMNKISACENREDNKNIMIKTEMNVFHIPYLIFHQTAVIENKNAMIADISVSLIDNSNYKRIKEWDDNIYITLKSFLGEN